MIGVTNTKRKQVVCKGKQVWILFLSSWMLSFIASKEGLSIDFKEI
jgi:hypothetical protein